MNKRFREYFYKGLMVFSVMLVFASLALILGINMIKGGLTLLREPHLLFSAPGPKYLLGGEGGILHAILGSLYMVLPSTLMAALLGYAIALFLQVDYIKKRVADKIRVLFDVLWGIPSVIYGVFVLNVLILLNQRGNLLFAIITLTLLQLPIMTRYMDEALRSVPDGIRESMYSLGATRLETALVTARYGLPGILAGILLGLGRAMGDAASVVFTAGAGNTMPKGLLYPATSLPLLIFLQSNSYYPNVREHAYAASFVLIAIVAVINIISRLLTRYFRKFTSGGNDHA